MSRSADVDDPNDHPRAVDPDDPRVDELYVASGSTSSRRYHTDQDCTRLKDTGKPRQAHIAAAWHPPCRYCVTGEYLPGGDDGG